jgi:HD-GYP domain-containing protein (c-di-GMP phosphodiesterase class II)
VRALGEWAVRESGPTRTYRGVALDEQFIPAVLEHLDDGTTRLSRTATEWAERIALQLGLGDEDIHVLRLAALLHAIGQVGLSPGEADAGQITSEEEALLRRSPALLGRLLPDRELDRVIDAVAFSGEHYDGSGRPRRLQGEAIPLFARIISVTTSFLGLTMVSPGAAALSREEAYDRLRQETGRYDPSVLHALGRVLGRPSADSGRPEPVEGR